MVNWAQTLNEGSGYLGIRKIGIFRATEKTTQGPLVPFALSVGCLSRARHCAKLHVNISPLILKATTYK